MAVSAKFPVRDATEITGIIAHPMKISDPFVVVKGESE